MKKKTNNGIYFYLVLIGFIAFIQITWKVLTSYLFPEMLWSEIASAIE